MSNTYSIVTNSPNGVPWKLNNLLYPFNADLTIQDNTFFTLQWSSVNEWYRFIPKAPLNGVEISFFFEMGRPARVTHNDTTVAATGVDIWINDNSAAVPGAASRWNSTTEGTMRGHFMATAKGFMYVYTFGADRNLTLGHQYHEAQANLIA